MTAIGFYLWSGVSVFMLLVILRNANQFVKATGLYLGFVLAWLVYIFLLVKSGVLLDFGMPPKVPLLIIIPMIIGMIYTTRLASFKPLLVKTSKYIPVYLQSFRIVVELLIFSAFVDGTFPQRVTFEGLNYDILVGISALPMGFLAQKGRVKGKGILVWNIISLSILSLTGFSFIYSFYSGDFATTDQGVEFVSFPYVLLPAVMLQVAIFLHIFSIRQTLLKEAA
ncbi:MAG: hypothetical protein AAFX87_10160 [Bacteroidota bacterium]